VGSLLGQLSVSSLAGRFMISNLMGYEDNGALWKRSHNICRLRTYGTEMSRLSTALVCSTGVCSNQFTLLTET